MSSPSPAPARVASVDAYRGFVMLLMLAEVLNLRRMGKNFPGDAFWEFLAFHQDHVAWRGCSLHDLIQPSFSFLVGVALPFSLLSRAGRAEPLWLGWRHAVWRAALLIALGVFLRSMGKPQTNFTFEDTLSQIGLGYVFLYGLARLRPAWQWAAFGTILVGYWLAFAVYPLPPADFDYKAVNGLAVEERPTGFAAHWDKNSNTAWAFDAWLLNQFPREAPFTHNRGGYATLSFIPTLATMILGLLAGGWLRTQTAPREKIKRFVAVGLGLLASGWLLDATGICPNVKRIWTPAWVLFSAGWCFLLLALFAALLDTGLPGGWAFPLKVIGANSIAAYVGEHLIKGFVAASFIIHFGGNVFSQFGPYEPLASGVALLAVFWLILWWMYRRKVFVRI